MSFIRQVYRKYVLGNMRKTDTSTNVKQWKELLDKLPEAKDSIGLAYNKHLCRMTYFSPFFKFVMNVFSAGALILALPKILRKSGPGRSVKKGTLLLETQKHIGYQDIVPEIMLSDYENVLYVDKKDSRPGDLVDTARKLFFECIRRHPFSFWFNFLNLEELSVHSRYIMNYDMEACACYSYEKPPAGPIVAELYERTGRRLIGFMHGDFLLQLHHSHMGFSEYYVWDDAYIDMYQNDLKCQNKKYVVYTPLKLQKKWNLEKIEPEYCCTYYFSGEKIDIMYKIAKIFNKLAAMGYKCKVRPHPRATTYLAEMEAAFKDVLIENPREISVHDSLAQTKYVVSTVSTIISEAFIEGREIILDDMSNPALFSSLRELRAIALTKKHILLSDFCRSVSSETDWLEEC